MKKEVKKVEKTTNFRYVCVSCTNTGFYSELDAPFKSKICQSCGKTLEYKHENYIKLNA